jgi:hypothetical protein
MLCEKLLFLLLMDNGKVGITVCHGDVFMAYHLFDMEANGTVSITAINTTIILMKADGTKVKVIGPLIFSVKKALAGDKLYKFLNAP